MLRSPNRERWPRLRRVDHAGRMADRGFPVHFFIFHLSITIQYTTLQCIIHSPANHIPALYSDAPHNCQNSPSHMAPVFNTKPNPAKARPLFH